MASTESNIQFQLNSRNAQKLLGRDHQLLEDQLSLLQLATHRISFNW